MTSVFAVSNQRHSKQLLFKSRVRSLFRHLAFILLSLLFAPSSYAAVPLVLDWDAETWSPLGSLNQTYNGTAQAPGSIVFNVTDPDSGLQSATPRVINQANYNGGISPTPNVLAYATQYAAGDVNRFVTTTIDFNYGNGVTGLSFSIFDVDIGSGFIDQVTVTATDISGNTINPSAINVGSAVTSDGVNTVTGNANVGGGANGNATFSFNQPGINQVTITYRNIITGTPGFQVIALHDINYSYLVPDLSTSTKSVVDVNGNELIPGDTLRYTITLNNTGDDAFGSVNVTDDVPATTENFNVVSTPTGATNASTGAGTGANGTGFLDVSNISVPGGASETIVFDVDVTATAPANTVISNTATTSVTGGTGATSSAPNITVATAVDLVITKDDSTLTYTPGGTGTYTLLVSNNGPHDAVNVTVTDSLPAGVSINGSWSCTPTGSASCISGSAGASTTGSGNISQAVDIPSGGSVTFTVPALFSSNPAAY